MKDFVSQICALSVLCGLALSLAPEGSVKKVTALGCSALLLLCLATEFKSLDYSQYSLELARYRELGTEMTEDTMARVGRLERRVIEQECADYIEKQAQRLGAASLTASVTARWDTEGLWVPERVTLAGSANADQKERLRQLIAAELGVDDRHQEWLTDED